MCPIWTIYSNEKHIHASLLLFGQNLPILTLWSASELVILL